MAEKPAGHILIECPNTIFHLYARDEGELSKIETFLRNIRGIKRLGREMMYSEPRYLYMVQSSGNFICYKISLSQGFFPVV